jgi:Ca2+-dependent lipid-binding protein
MKDVLQVKVFDHDVLAPNNLLGIANIPLSKFMTHKGQIFDEWVPLMKKRKIFGLKKGRGQVHMQFMYGPKMTQ